MVTEVGEEVPESRVEWGEASEESKDVGRM